MTTEVTLPATRMSINPTYGGPSVFAIDPGESTGWAFISPYDCSVGTIVKHNVVADKTEDVEGRLLVLLAEFAPDQIVIERMPEKMNGSIHRIVRDCEQAILEHLNGKNGFSRISPSEWKPVASKFPLPFPMQTIHEKDAYRIGRYYLWKCYGISKEEFE